MISCCLSSPISWTVGKSSQSRGKAAEWEVVKLVDGIKVSRPRRRGIDVVKKYKRLKFLARTLEVKRAKRGLVTLYRWVDQAKEEGADAVVFRQDRHEWLVVLRLSDALELEEWT